MSEWEQSQDEGIKCLHDRCDGGGIIYLRKTDSKYDYQLDYVMRCSCPHGALRTTKPDFDRGKDGNKESPEDKWNKINRYNPSVSEIRGYRL